MLLPEPKHTPTKHTPLSRIPPREPIEPLEIIPTPTDGKSEKHAAYLDSQKEPCVINALGGQAPFPSS